MPDYRRTPRRLLAYLLAVPVIVLVYIGAFGTRVWAALRPFVATFLGATVIGSVYADEALKRAPATPMRAAAVLALAVALVGPGMAPAPAMAAQDPAESVIAAARDYLDRPFQLGAEGPKLFDCSGLIYRAFLDAGELPRVGGMRLRAVGYMRWFLSRGLFTRDVDKADRGDLVIWGMGEHIGIYLGGNKAISALVNPWGVTVHSLNGIRLKVDYFLRVNWRNGDGPGDPGPGPDPEPTEEPEDPGAGPGNGNSTGRSDKGGSGNGRNGPSDVTGNGQNTGNNNANKSNKGNGRPPNEPANEPKAGRGKQGFTTGTLNMRTAADPDARIIGWVGRNKTIRILGTGTSPAGYTWYEVQTVNGKHGWVYGYWVREL